MPSHNTTTTGTVSRCSCCCPGMNCGSTDASENPPPLLSFELTLGGTCPQIGTVTGTMTRGDDTGSPPPSDEFFCCSCHCDYVVFVPLNPGYPVSGPQLREIEFVCGVEGASSPPCQHGPDMKCQWIVNADVYIGDIDVGPICTNTCGLVFPTIGFTLDCTDPTHLFGCRPGIRNSTDDAGPFDITLGTGCPGDVLHIFCPVMGPRPERIAAQPGTDGTELKNLIASLGIQPGDICGKGCGELAALMDRRGHEWCQRKAGWIADRLRENAQKAGWVTWGTAALRSIAQGLVFDPRDPFPGIVNLAIQRAS